MTETPKKYFLDLYLSPVWYIAACTASVFFLLAFFFPLLWLPSLIFFFSFLALSLVDYILLFLVKGSLEVTRVPVERMNLGEHHDVKVNILNRYPFLANTYWIDEVPVQYQMRNFKKKAVIPPGTRHEGWYSLRPLSRGEYAFGRIIVYMRTPLQLLERRVNFALDQVIKVYPSTLQIKKYQLLALSDHTPLPGEKKVRKIGHSLEFEQIKEYVNGDDIRTLNWNATARKGALMVNNFTDAKMQQVYCLIDKGRAMKMPFDGLTLLDHAINASLMLLNTVLLKQDKAGLITFSSKVNEVIPADRNGMQMHKIIEALYRQQTDFRDADYEALTAMVHRKLSHRCFIMLFTNFETMASLERQLPYLRKLASRHLICVVFFENTLLKSLDESYPDTLEGVYVKTIAARFSFEKKQIVKELRRYGILSVLTTPKDLTIDVLNKYLEVKARQMI